MTTATTLTRAEKDAIYAEWKAAERACDAAFAAWDAAYFTFPQDKAEVKRLSDIHDHAWERLQRAFKAQIKAGTTPLAPAAPVTPSTETPAETPADSHRIRGTVVYVNGRRGSIAYEGGLDTQWFAFILGGVMPVHGMAVEFEFAGMLFGHKAVNVVAVGHAASEAAYQALLAAPKRPNPAEERRALQDRVKANLRESSARLREIEKARIAEIRKAHGLE